ncbi:MAG TPA: hypothetical protein VFJ24_01390 [Gaiellales bacterium]|nr:hypothetical protein [Gaiellales bacterium]
MTIRILDPTVPPERAEASPAKRLRGLDGMVVGLLSNGKVNGDALLRLVGDKLVSRHGVRELVVREKPNASRVAPTDLVDQLVTQCDAVVTAIGD